MSFWAEIKANYNEYECAAPENDIISSICIDAWKTNNGNKGGSVIAKVIMTRSGDKGVVYIDNLARSDPYAQEVIKETLDNMVLPPDENTITAFTGNGTLNWSACQDTISRFLNGLTSRFRLPGNPFAS